jgi:predicted amidohydrolase YtcJ
VGDSALPAAGRPLADLKHRTTQPPGTEEGLLSTRRLKLLADGSLGAGTAALRKCYCGSDSRGVQIYDQETLNSRVADAHKRECCCLQFVLLAVIVNFLSLFSPSSQYA